MFQAYKMKMVGSYYPGIKSYEYKKCTINVSREDGNLAVSIAPHDYEKKPELPEKEELNGILSYFGFNPDAPFETFSISHYGMSGLGDTQYFVQSVS